MKEISIINNENKVLSNFIKIIIFVFIKLERIVTGFFKVKPGDSIVVIDFHKIGDSIFTLPTLNEIRKYYNKDFYIFCFEETRPIFELFYKTQYILTFNHSDFIYQRITRSIVRKKLKKINPAVIFDLTSGAIAATLLFNSTATEIIGISDHYYGPIYTKFLVKRKKPHLMDMYLDALKMIKPDIDEDVKVFPFGPNPDGYIIVHPFAGWTAKEWSLSRFIELSKKLNENYQTIILSESGKINKNIIDDITSAGLEVIETHNLSELFNIIKGGSLIISNDSGPLYLANLFGKPTFTIYGPTNPEFSLPYGSHHQFVRKQIKCSPEKNKQYCFTLAGRFGCPSFECMNLLTIEDVIKSVESFTDSLNIKKKIKNGN